MAIVVQDSAVDRGNASLTQTVDSSSSDFIVVLVGTVGLDNPVVNSISDSLGNSYTAVDNASGGNAVTKTYVCDNPGTGVGAASLQIDVNLTDDFSNDMYSTMSIICCTGLDDSDETYNGAVSESNSVAQSVDTVGDLILTAIYSSAAITGFGTGQTEITTGADSFGKGTTESPGSTGSNAQSYTDSGGAFNYFIASVVLKANNGSQPPTIKPGNYAKYSGSSQGLPGTAYALLDMGTEVSDTNSLVTESAGIFTPQAEGYYLVIAEGEFALTHNNRLNIEWGVYKDDVAQPGGVSTGYARNNSNELLWMQVATVVYCNGTTHNLRIKDKRDSGAGTPAGNYNNTNFKLIYLGYDACTYSRYYNPTTGAHANTTPQITTGWDAQREDDTDVIELQPDTESIRLKEANRPYLIHFSLYDKGAVGRTQRVADITLDGARVGASAGYVYQRDGNNEYAAVQGSALVYPTTANQELNIRAWLYDSDGTGYWGTINGEGWSLDGASGISGITVTALPADTDIAIFDDTTGGDTINGTGIVDLTLMKTETKAGTAFTKDNTTTVSTSEAINTLAVGAAMVYRTASSGTRNTSASRWEVGGVDQTDTVQGNYLRGDQGADDTPNMVLTSTFLGSADGTLQIEKFNPGTNSGNNDKTIWGGAYFIDLDTLDVAEPPTTKRYFLIS